MIKGTRFRIIRLQSVELTWPTSMGGYERFKLDCKSVTVESGAVLRIHSLKWNTLHVRAFHKAQGIRMITDVELLGNEQCGNTKVAICCPDIIDVIAHEIKERKVKESIKHAPQPIYEVDVILGAEPIDLSGKPRDSGSSENERY